MSRAPDHLDSGERIALFFGMGVVAGTIGINYSHELMHQKSRLERWLADLLLASVLYSHFRSEHLRVHHLHVGTPRDPVTARYNEGFHRFFPRVLRQCPPSAWKAEVAMLKRKDLPWHHGSNPFWRYAALQGGFLILALALGRLERAWPVPGAGLHRDLAAGAGELHRTLRADPPPPWERAV